jgi:hypothetical protein
MRPLRMRPRGESGKVLSEEFSFCSDVPRLTGEEEREGNCNSGEETLECKGQTPSPVGICRSGGNRQAIVDPVRNRDAKLSTVSIAQMATKLPGQPTMLTLSCQRIDRPRFVAREHSPFHVARMATDMPFPTPAAREVSFQNKNTSSWTKRTDDTRNDELSEAKRRRLKNCANNNDKLSEHDGHSATQSIASNNHKASAQSTSDFVYCHLFLY